MIFQIAKKTWVAATVHNMCIFDSGYICKLGTVGVSKGEEEPSKFSHVGRFLSLAVDHIRFFGSPRRWVGVSQWSQVRTGGGGAVRISLVGRFVSFLDLLDNEFHLCGCIAL